AFDRFAVAADTGARILRRKADSDHMLDAIRCNFPDHIGDERFPVPHGNVNGKVNLARQKLSLARSDFVERRMADERVTMFYLFEHLRRHGASAGDIVQILGDIVDRVGGAVREKEDSVFHGRFTAYLFTAKAPRETGQQSVGSHQLWWSSSIRVN